MENFHSKVLMGLTYIGSVANIDERFCRDAPYILTDHYELEIRCALYHIAFNKVAEKEDDLELVTFEYERLKRHIHDTVKRIFDEANQRSELEAQQRLEKIRTDVAISNKPHEMGTVAELAVRFGKSKSEIRRLKAQGLLHTLQMEQHA